MSGSALTAIAGAAWAFRRDVEDEAALRFDRFAQELSELDPGSPVIALAQAAAGDERRHAVHCAALAEHFGVPSVTTGRGLREIRPTGLPPKQALLYEVFAQCCVAETESMATLLELLTGADHGPVKPVLRELASDEVRHAQLGWAHLARASAAMPVAFLAPLIPRMLQGTAEALFSPAPTPAHEDAALIPLGVLPHQLKRTLFAKTIREVVLPGLEQFSIDPVPTARWLEQAARAWGLP